MKVINFILPVLLFLLISTKISAQHTITFNINLKPQLVDSIFVPDRDQILLAGNTYPLRLNRPMIMRDLEPIDSVYTVEVMFNQNQLNNLIEYNFILKINSESLQEDIPRRLKIRGDETLDALYFNSFAW